MHSVQNKQYQVTSKKKIYEKIMKVVNSLSNGVKLLKKKPNRPTLPLTISIIGILILSV